jgi:hypothetical protein
VCVISLVSKLACANGSTYCAVLCRYNAAFYDSLKLLAVAYVGQELAHIISNERTFQSTYMNKGLSIPGLLLEHTYYLLPLCLDAFVNMQDSIAGWFVAHNYVVGGLYNL